MTELLARTLAIGDRCRIGVKLEVKNIKSNLKKLEMQRKKEIMNSVQKMGRELENMLTNYGFTDHKSKKTSSKSITMARWQSNY